MTSALLRLVKRVTRQFGPHAADALVHAIRTWTIDPSNSAARARLVAALSDIARRAEGLTAQLALSAAAGVERYRRSVGSWERELMAARYAIPQLPTGDVRAAALATYLGHGLVSDLYWYFSVTPELMSVVAERFQTFGEQLSGDAR